MLLQFIKPWFLSFCFIALFIAFIYNPWHPLFLILGGIIVISFAAAIYLGNQYPTQKEFELKMKINELSNITEFEEVIQKRAELVKQKAIWDTEIQQLVQENDERKAQLDTLNQEIAVLSSSTLPFLPENSHK